MSETTVLFAQSIVVLAFVYLTAILIGAVIHFFYSREGDYWGNAVFVCVSHLHCLVVVCSTSSS
jgi:hypothetical protein